MKSCRFIKRFLTALTALTAIIMLSASMASAKQVPTDELKESGGAQVVLSENITDEDEAAILKIVNAYSLRRNADTKLLENQINDYFIAEYGVARSFYIVEFKVGTGGTLAGRTTYVLMNGGDVKYLNDAAGGFVAPSPQPRSGYAFDTWLFDGMPISNEELGTYPIYGSTVFYAGFGLDKNGDGVPDSKQPKYMINYTVNNLDFGYLAGRTDFYVLGPVDGSPISLSSSLDFTIPEVRPNSGYAFDKWVNEKNETIDSLCLYMTNMDQNITAVFAVDKNNDGIPDYKQKFYQVVFTHGQGGMVASGTLEYSVLAKPSGEASRIYEASEDPPTAYANDGYVFTHWVDLLGNVISNNPYAKEIIYEYPITGDTVIVAIFAEDKNNDGIPDDEQEFFEVMFATGIGGYVTLDKSIIMATDKDGNYPILLPAFDMFTYGPIDGYAFSHWDDQNGNSYYGDDWYYIYTVKEDMIFVAVFEEDINGDQIPDSMQDRSFIVFQVENPVDGYLYGRTEFVYFWGSNNEGSELRHAFGGFEVPKAVSERHVPFWQINNDAISTESLQYISFGGVGSTVVITCKFVRGYM